ncbi:ComEC/Rec2 family competence protein [Candidatus Saccharibacteria bacterium]|nr:ComEC/Rec2 family competence protein [Candidatus Saccharibacteria bacterium]
MLKKIHPSWYVVALAVAVILSTIIIVIAGWDGVGEQLKQYVGQTTELTGKVSEDPDTDDSKTALRLSEIEAGDTKVSGTVYVSMAKNSEIKRSDRVTLNGSISEGFGTFAVSMYRPKLVKIERTPNADMMLTVRDNFAEIITKYIPEAEAKLGLAYLLGMKGGLEDDLTETLRVVGLVHIVVASGTHMSILVGIARRIFGRVSRFAGLVFALILILAFGGVVGWTASITRAALVSGLSVAMWYMGRRFEAWRLILIVMAITLIINPMYLTNLGWLLSFSAFGGILILTPVLAKLLYGDKKPNFVAETLLATISATVTCLPISLYFFGTVSLISLIANLLILPTMPYVMGLIFMTGVMGWWPFAGEWLGRFSTWALDYHLAVVNFFGEQKMFLIEIAPQNPLVFLLYIPIAGLVIYATIKRWKLSPKQRLSSTEKDWLMV